MAGGQTEGSRSRHLDGLGVLEVGGLVAWGFTNLFPLLRKSRPIENLEH